MKKTVKIGVVGVGRGSTMMQFCKNNDNAELVAICDKWEDGLNAKKAELNDDRITYYTSFSEFLKHDMDAVVLAKLCNRACAACDRMPQKRQTRFK